MNDDVETTILPPHIESTVAAIAKLHAEHHQRATPFQHMTEDLTAKAGKPEFIAWLSFAVIGWISLNLILMAAGQKQFDPPPCWKASLALRRSTS